MSARVCGRCNLDIRDGNDGPGSHCVCSGQQSMRRPLGTAPQTVAGGGIANTYHGSTHQARSPSWNWRRPQGTAATRAGVPTGAVKPQEKQTPRCNEVNGSKKGVGQRSTKGKNTGNHQRNSNGKTSVKSGNTGPEANHWARPTGGPRKVQPECHSIDPRILRAEIRAANLESKLNDMTGQSCSSNDNCHKMINMMARVIDVLQGQVIGADNVHKGPKSDVPQKLHESKGKKSQKVHEPEGTITCMFCGKKNHFAFQCFKLKAKKREYDAKYDIHVDSKHCKHCGGPHLSPGCWRHEYPRVFTGRSSGHSQ